MATISIMLLVGFIIMAVIMAINTSLTIQTCGRERKIVISTIVSMVGFFVVTAIMALCLIEASSVCESFKSECDDQNKSCKAVIDQKVGNNNNFKKPKTEQGRTEQDKTEQAKKIQNKKSTLAEDAAILLLTLYPMFF